MNAFDFAIKLEQDGKKFYEKLARDTDNVGLKNIFSRLASYEQKHYDIFLALKGRQPVAEMADTTVLEMETKADIVIIGAGPAGLQAAIHAARHKAAPLVPGKPAKSSLGGARAA